MEDKMEEYTRKVSVILTHRHYNYLDNLVKEGRYNNFSEVVRDAIRKFMEEGWEY